MVNTDPNTEGGDVVNGNPDRMNAEPLSETHTISV